MFYAVWRIIDAFTRRVQQENDDIFDTVVMQHIKHKRYLLISDRGALDAKRTEQHSKIRYAKFVDDAKRYIDALAEMRAQELDGLTHEVCAASHAARLLAQSEEQSNDVVVSIQPNAVRALGSIEPHELVPPPLTIMEFRASMVFNVLFTIIKVRRTLRQIRNGHENEGTLLALNGLRSQLSSAMTDTAWLVICVDAVQYPCLVRWGERLKRYVRKTREAIDVVEKTKLETPEETPCETE